MPKHRGLALLSMVAAVTVSSPAAAADITVNLGVLSGYPPLAVGVLVDPFGVSGYFGKAPGTEISVATLPNPIDYLNLAPSPGVFDFTFSVKDDFFLSNVVARSEYPIPGGFPDDMFGSASGQLFQGSTFLGDLVQTASFKLDADTVYTLELSGQLNPAAPTSYALGIYFLEGNLSIIVPAVPLPGAAGMFGTALGFLAVGAAAARRLPR